MPFIDELQQRTAREREDLLSIRVIRDCLAGQVRRDQYCAFLREAYHHVKHTVPLLQACMERIGPQRTTVREALAHYIEDERGHEEWILDDLRACGEDAERVRRGAPAPATRRMVEYVYDYIERSNPVGFFGMAHVLEGTSSALATRAAHMIGRTLALPPSALSYLTSHGSLDQDHVRFFAGVVNALPAEDQEAVVHVAGAVYRLYGDIFRGLPQ